MSKAAYLPSGNKESNMILSAIDKKYLTGVILLDTSKAFDNMDHTLLLVKLQDVGASPFAFQLFRSSNQSLSAGLSIRAGRRPKLLASQQSLAGYFHLNLPVLLMKNLTVIKITSKKLVKHPFPIFEQN